MIVDTHVHVIAPDAARYPLRPSGVGSQWFREHPVSVEEFCDDLERTLASTGPCWCRPRCVQHRQLVRPRSGCIRRPIRQRRDRRARRRVDVCATLLRCRDAAASGCSGSASNHPCGSTATRASRCGTPRPNSTCESSRRCSHPSSRGCVPCSDVTPTCPVVLDHCGFPDLRGGPPFVDAASLFELAAFPNLHLKVTSHVLEDADDDAAAFVEQLSDDVRRRSPRVGFRLPADPRPPVRGARRARARRVRGTPGRRPSPVPRRQRGAALACAHGVIRDSSASPNIAIIRR